MFDLFQATLEATVDAARREGNYDEGIVDIAATSITISGEPRVVRKVRPPRAAPPADRHRRRVWAKSAAPCPPSRQSEVSFLHGSADRLAAASCCTVFGTTSKLQLTADHKPSFGFSHIWQDRSSGAKTLLYTVMVDRGVPWEAAQQMLQEAAPLRSAPVNGASSLQHPDALPARPATSAVAPSGICRR